MTARIISPSVWALAALLGGASLAPCAAAPQAAAGLEGPGRHADDGLKLNDMQVVGTHNSYKQAIPPLELSLIRQRDRTAAVELDYAHAPLQTELDLGMRAIELDVVYDPAGGRYAKPLLPAMTAGQPGAVPYDASEMAAPGFKVLHVPDIDVRSSCARFITCLRELKNWSDAHPGHVPILVTLNAKDDGEGVSGGVTPLPFDEAAFAALDREILSVFAGSDLITPDQVRGNAPTLREAVRRDGWPSLAESRGKFIFALDEGPKKVRLYMRSHASLEGLPMFVNSIDRSAPHAAYFTMNYPISGGARIRAAVRAGFLVRTRADEGTHEARDTDTHRREAAFASGAQFVSTDYPTPQPDFGPYKVELPQTPPARCNPVRHPGGCPLAQ